MNFTSNVSSGYEVFAALPLSTKIAAIIVMILVSFVMWYALELTCG